MIPLAPYLHEFQKGSVHDNPNHGLDLELTVMHRKNRKDWLVTMTMEDWMELYEKQRIHRDQ